jgi:type IV secretion system protein VirB10
MNDRPQDAQPDERDEDGASIPGVTRRRRSMVGLRAVLAVGLLAFSLMAVIGITAVRFWKHKQGQTEITAPDVASARGKTVQIPEQPQMPAPAPAPKAPEVPKIDTAEPARPIEVRGSSSSQKKPVAPEDAPLFAGNTTGSAGRAGSTGGAAPDSPVTEAEASLDTYQRQLKGMVDQLQKATGAATNRGTGASPAQAAQPGTPSGAQAAAGQLFGSMESTPTPRVAAQVLGDRSLTIPKGTSIPCALKTKVITATSGMVGCQTTRDVYSDDGKVVLLERASHLDGEYRIMQVHPGVTRIPVMWVRARTPLGITVDLASPATGPLGESGLGGYVDNRWGERIGGALLLSVIDDAIKIATVDRDAASSGNTIVMPNTVSQGSKLAEKVLEATINIPPLLYQNQGSLAAVYVARDIDFRSVYELRPQ